MGRIVHTPWSEEQVNRLNQYQVSSGVHPFNDNKSRPLVATKDGWHTVDNEKIIQEWAWDWMLNWDERDIWESGISSFKKN